MVPYFGTSASFSMLRPVPLLICGIVTVFLSASNAGACPRGQSRTSFGFCLPNIGGDVGRAGQAIGHAVRERRTQACGLALHPLIQQSRNGSRRGARIIPPQIKRALMMRDVFSRDLLEKVRYRVGDKGALNLAHNTLHFNKNIVAVALIDTIVFRDDHDAQRNVQLWAHELWHLQQYRKWGLRGFALRYCRDFGAVEREAEEIEAKFSGIRPIYLLPPGNPRPSINRPRINRGQPITRPTVR